MQYNELHYNAYKIKDVKSDGKFFVGVISTGIYCRPVCTAKMPKQKNCLFFPSSIVAKENGFRPCRRCRPELIPGFSTVDMTSYLARSAKNLIEKELLNELTISQLAQRLGITSRHLQRIFVSKFGMNPSKFIQIHRLTIAKKLLKNSDLTVMDVALKAGFNSVRQFNGLFKRNCNLTPSKFRHYVLSTVK